MTGRWNATLRLLHSADMARAYALAAFAGVLTTDLIAAMAGSPTTMTITGALAALGVAILIVRRRELTVARIAPTTLVLFLVWAVASVGWSTNGSETFARWVYTVAVATIAVTIAHIRDTLQTVRALGNVLRVLLIASVIVEVLSGITFDVPFPQIGVLGNLADGGPIQGVFGTRNMLGFVCVLAVLTFATELATRSIGRALGWSSIGVAAVLAVFSASPSVLILASAVGVAALILILVRRVSAERRLTVQAALGVVVLVGGIAAYAARSQLVDLVGARGDLLMRTRLWDMADIFIRWSPVEGWGWYGRWDRSQQPFATINIFLDAEHSSALNAFVDLAMQVGWAGTVLFIAFVGLGLVRGWLDGSTRRSPVYTWTPLILITILAVSVFESFALTGPGWLLVVLAATRAGQNRSWRERLSRPSDHDGEPGLPASPG